MPEVPKVMNFLAVGKAPAAAAANVASFVAKNPSWKANVWCDSTAVGVNPILAVPNVLVNMIDAKTMGAPDVCVSPSSEAAKDALAMRILLKVGGCYIDNDVKAGDPLPSLNVSENKAMFGRTSSGQIDDSVIACAAGSDAIRSAMLKLESFAQGNTQSQKAAVLGVLAQATSPEAAPPSCYVDAPSGACPAS
jgi:hypothetical protein